VDARAQTTADSVAVVVARVVISDVSVLGGQGSLSSEMVRVEKLGIGKLGGVVVQAVGIDDEVTTLRKKLAVEPNV
jgi:hypothetical protein